MIRDACSKSPRPISHKFHELFRNNKNGNYCTTRSQQASQPMNLVASNNKYPWAPGGNATRSLLLVQVDYQGDRDPCLAIAGVVISKYFYYYFCYKIIINLFKNTNYLINCVTNVKKVYKEIIKCIRQFTLDAIIIIISTAGTTYYVSVCKLH